jgi:2,4-dienoyl-CoA reductase-like NADH-dependent reductase (Old Yellow Enzyme family)
MAPMTREFSPDGMPGADVAQYYRRRAEGGCGLLITEGTTIESPVASGYRNVPYLWGAALEGWKRVAEAVHAAGGAIMPLLWHVGHTRNPAKCPNAELPSQSPSGVGPKLEKVTEPMTIGEIQGTVEAFARGARQLLDRLEANEFDLVAVGRALITDPAWVRKIRKGLFGELLPFDASALMALN